MFRIVIIKRPPIFVGSLTGKRERCARPHPTDRSFADPSSDIKDILRKSPEKCQGKNPRFSSIMQLEVAKVNLHVS